jgi:3-deoxy-D-manno-octulosonic-acid transferase
MGTVVSECWERTPFVPYLLNVFYLLLILLVLPWLVWQSVRKGKYREGFAAKLLGRVPRRASQKTCVWLHAVSVGEVNLLAPLIREIERERPDWECVVSTTTATGMALAKKNYAGLMVFYCPLDFSWAVAAAMRQIRRAGAVAEPDSCGPAVRRPRGGGQRTPE